MAVKGVDVALSKVAAELPNAANDIIHTAWRALGKRYAWHTTYPRPEQLADGTSTC